MLDIKGLNEECGVFAVSNNKDAVTLSYYGLHCLQHRGQEAAGIAFRKNGHIETIRGKGLVAEVLTNEQISNANSTELIGHVRNAISNVKSSVNIQPFNFKFYDENIALASNGFLGNGKLLRRVLESKGSVFTSTSDSEILIHLLRSERGSFHDRLVNSLVKLDGAFAYVMLHDTGLYGIRDRYGLRPLSIGQLSEDSYVLTSETCVFNVIGAKFVRDVEPGEIVRIHNGKIESSFYAKSTSQNLCLMEYIYFSRPDSSLDGTNVHFARKLSGKILSQEAGIDADIVVGVPDSSTSAAIGYAEATGIPYEMGLIKNRYVGRTFIQPTQELREKGVRMKLSAVTEIVGGKRIVLIDDSIVRGTTSKRIVQLLREAGAKEVHVRIASPAIKYPCYYGVDITTYEELISSRLDVEELKEYIEADSLAFLSLAGLEDALLTTKYGQQHPDEGRYCTACFNGNYVTNLYEDIHELNKENL